MDFFYAIVVVLAAVAAFTVQREMVNMQYLGSGGAPGSAADRMIIYSTRVVTPEGVIPAAVHVFDGRIQDIVPSNKPPKNPKVRRSLRKRKTKKSDSKERAVTRRTDGRGRRWKKNLNAQARLFLSCGGDDSLAGQTVLLVQQPITSHHFAKCFLVYLLCNRCAHISVLCTFSTRR